MNTSPLLSVLLMLCLSYSLVAQDGILDLTFGENGFVITDIDEFNDVANEVKVQSDGKIIVSGFTSNGIKDFFCLARYHPDGVLDSEFGEGGIVVTEFSSTSVSATMALQSDGKILLGGHTWGGAANEFAMVRYLEDGSMDNSFGEMGMVNTLFPSKNVVGSSLAIQNDGKIVLGGRAYTFDSDADDFALARYHPDGGLDQSFGFGGLLITSLGDFTMDWLNKLVIQSDGKIVAAGFSDASFALVRYDANGSLDHDFGNNGKVITSLTGSEHGVLSDVQLLEDGKILGAGFIRDSFSDFALVCYTSNGNLDASFGDQGVVRTQVSTESDGIESIVIQDDGKIVVGGTAFMGAQHQFKLARYDLDGNLDSSFGQDGITLDNMHEFDHQLLSIALQPDGNILACGFSGSFPYDIVLSRYTARPVQVENISMFPGHISLFPNPAKDFINVNLVLNEVQYLTMSLLNVDGKVLKTLNTNTRKHAGAHQFLVPLSELTEGIYFLSIEIEGKVFSYKLVK